MGKITKARELFEVYPNLKLEKKGKLHAIGGDLFWISPLGRIERVTEGSIYKIKNKAKFMFRIDKSVLVDEGIKEEEIIK